MKKPFDLTFSVGPTQISQAVKDDIAHAVANNFLSVSHRGEDFTQISEMTVNALRKLYNVPEDYRIFFTTSATEGWEICARNLVEKEAFSFVCGHFSNAFAHCLNSWGKTCHEDVAPWGKLNDHLNVEIPQTAELITLCHNETSTGVTVPDDTIQKLRQKYSDHLLAIDVTSSIGACKLDINQADVWYFSTQKGWGLPSGLGVMFVGPRAMAKSKALLNKHLPQGFFNFTNMEKQMADGKYQTIQTPNILNIYLLGQQCKRLQQTGLQNVHNKTLARASDLYNFFESHPNAKPFVEDPTVRSPFSLCIELGEENLTHYKQKASQQNIELGAGYGKLKKTHIRIANYPALADGDFEILKEIFES